MDTSTIELIRHAAQTHFAPLSCFIFGGLGGLVREVVDSKDGGLALPKIKNGKLYLNCLVGFLVGGSIGFVLNGSIITAFGWGIGSSEIFDRMYKSKSAADTVGIQS